MSETKFTPGPWFIRRGMKYDGGGEDLCIGAGPTWAFASVGTRRRCPDTHIPSIEHDEEDCAVCSLGAAAQVTEEQLANAHLIAAAPDLYAALVSCGDYLAARNLGAASDTLLERIRAALKTAHGEVPLERAIRMIDPEEHNRSVRDVLEGRVVPLEDVLRELRDDSDENTTLG